MSCAFEKELLSAYHDGELDAAGRARVEGHVGRCGECSRELEDVRAVSTTLRSAGRVAAPAGIAGIVARGAETRTAPKVFKIRRYLEAGLAAAAGLMIVFAVVAVFRSGDSRAPVSAPAVSKRSAQAEKQRGAERLGAVRKGDDETLARGAHPGERGDSGDAVPMSAAGEAPPAPPASEPGFAPPGEPGIAPGAEEPAPSPDPGPPIRETNVLVIGDDIRSADEAVNELLRKLSTDYRRRDSVWEATLTEAATRNLLAALQTRADVQVVAAPQAGEMLARLADEAWHHRDAFGADKANFPRAKGGRRSPEDSDQAFAKGGPQDQRKDRAAQKAPPALPSVPAPDPEPALSRGGRGGGGAEPAPGGLVEPEEELSKAIRETQKVQTGAAAHPKPEAGLERVPEARKAPLRSAKGAERELPEDKAVAERQGLVTLRIYIVAPEQSEKLREQPAGRDK